MRIRTDGFGAIVAGIPVADETVLPAQRPSLYYAIVLAFIMLPSTTFLSE